MNWLSIRTSWTATVFIGFILNIMGATVSSVVGLISKDFLKLVLVALVIASPLAYYLMDSWLADFAYCIEIQWWIFLVAGCFAITISFLMVGYQSVKAALENPMEHLKGE